MSDNRRLRGAHYTPEPVAAMLARTALHRLFQTHQSWPPTVLDPACGDGALLIAAFRWLIENRPSHVQAVQIAANLTGWDCDAEACAAAARNLRAALMEVDPDAPADFQPRIVQCDGLLEDPDTPFDLVIGNPPWISWSGRQAVPLPAPYKRTLSHRFDLSGWPTAHGLFVQTITERLASNTIALLLPDQVGHLPGYATTRSRILQAGLQWVQWLGEDVFPEAITPALALVAVAGHPGGVHVVEPDGTTQLVPIKNTQSWSVPLAAALRARLSKNTWSLGKLVGDPGVHTGNCASLLVVAPEDATPSDVPLLEGKKVHAYTCGSPDRFLRLKAVPSKGQYFRIAKEMRYQNARFLIRQTARYPIVGPRKEALYFRNSLLALYDPPPPYDVRYLVGLLNSRLFRFLHTASGRDGRQQAFPQVKCGALRALPIRAIDFKDQAQRKHHDEIVRLVQKAIDASGTPQAISAIDHSVNALYGIKSGELELIARTLADQTPA